MATLGKEGLKNPFKQTRKGKACTKTKFFYGAPRSFFILGTAPDCQGCDFPVLTPRMVLTAKLKTSGKTT
jgi:hypothetical protein